MGLRRKITVRFLFPLLALTGKLLPGLRDRVERKIIEINNSILTKGVFKTAFLLLPHCIQFDKCEFKITSNILNCRACGKCDIAEIVKTAQKYGIETKVATGGRLAKRLVKENGADLFIAVACERELVEGIFGAYPSKVFAVINLRPDGPCINTKVDVNYLNTAVEGFLRGYKS